MSAEKRRILCPNCHNRRLQVVKREQTEVDVCLKCGGFWLDHGELEQIVRRYDPNSPLGSSFQDIFTPKEASDTKRNCPICKIPLIPYQVTGPDKNFVIDACDTCEGVWLDQGELEHAQVLNQVPEALEKIEGKLSAKDWFVQFLLGLPVEFNVKPRRFPIITVLLILFNTIIFMFEYSLLSQATESSAKSILHFWALIPGHIGSLLWFMNLFSYQFLHGGLYHLLGNMYFLYVLGDNLEDALGRTKFLIFYLACGVSAGLVETLFSLDSQTPILGASGAIAGIMAAYAVIFRRSYLTFMVLYWQFKLPSYWYFAIWIGFNMLGMWAGKGNTAWFAHLGGFLAGLIIAFMIYDKVLEQNPLIKYLNS